MDISQNYSNIDQCDLFEINAGCWLCKVGQGLMMIGGVLFAVGASGVLCFVGVFVAVVGGIFALIS